MQKIFGFFLCLVTGTVLTGCQLQKSTQTPVRKKSQQTSQPGGVTPSASADGQTTTPQTQTGDPSTQPLGQPDASTTSSVTDSQTNKTTSSTQLPPPTTPNAAPRYPYANKVAGQEGFVVSPHAPDAGLVDVRNPATGKPYPRGTEVKCPYTGKIFLVP